jgi:hypothetical protein
MGGDMTKEVGDGRFTFFLSATVLVLDIAVWLIVFYGFHESTQRHGYGAATDANIAVCFANLALTIAGLMGGWRLVEWMAEKSLP